MKKRNKKMDRILDDMVNINCLFFEALWGGSIIIDEETLERLVYNEITHYYLEDKKQDILNKDFYYLMDKIKEKIPTTIPKHREVYLND